MTLHVLARGLLAGLTLTLSMSLPSYACERSESSEEAAVDGEIDKAIDTVRLARRAGWPEPLVRLVGALAMAETRGYNERVGDRRLENEKWGPSVGLTQLRTLRSQTGTGGPRDIERISDPLENMRAALELYRGGRFDVGGETYYEPGGAEQWSTYTSGAYKDFVPLIERAMGLQGRVR